MPNLFYLSYAALWLLVIFHSLLLLGLVRIVYQLQQTGAAADKSVVKLGQEAPKFSTVDLFGRPIHSTDLAGHLTALLFVSPSCSLCTTTLTELEALNSKAKGNVIVICRAGHEDCARLAKEYKLTTPVAADEDGRLSQLYEISTVPMAVLIDADNRIQSYGQPLRGEEFERVFHKASEAEVQVVS